MFSCKINYFIIVSNNFLYLISFQHSLFDNKNCLLLQISTKFRDEMNPKLGFLRGREFIMKGYTVLLYVFIWKSSFSLCCNVINDFKFDYW